MKAGSNNEPPICHRTTYLSLKFVDYTTLMSLSTTYMSLFATYLTRKPPFCRVNHLNDALTTFMSYLEFLKSSVRPMGTGFQRFEVFPKNKVYKQGLKTGFNKQLITC